MNKLSFLFGEEILQFKSIHVASTGVKYCLRLMGWKEGLRFKSNLHRL